MSLWPLTISHAKGCWMEKASIATSWGYWSVAELTRPVSVGVMHEQFVSHATHADASRPQLFDRIAKSVSGGDADKPFTAESAVAVRAVLHTVCVALVRLHLSGLGS
jgi:hypothetical protein